MSILSSAECTLAFATLFPDANITMMSSVELTVEAGEMPTLQVTSPDGHTKTFTIKASVHDDIMVNYASLHHNFWLMRELARFMAIPARVVKLVLCQSAFGLGRLTCTLLPMSPDEIVTWQSPGTGETVFTLVEIKDQQ